MTGARSALCLLATARRETRLLLDSASHLGAMWSMFAGRRAEEQAVSRHNRTSVPGAACDAMLYAWPTGGPSGARRQICLAGCWAQRATQTSQSGRAGAPQRCGWMLSSDRAHLYRVETLPRRSGAGPRKRAAVRMSQHRPRCGVCTTLWSSLGEIRAAVCRAAGVAGPWIMLYSRIWPLLGVFYSRRSPHPNETVRTSWKTPLQPEPALGAERWLFLGSADAGQRSAILYTPSGGGLPLPQRASILTPTCATCSPSLTLNNQLQVSMPTSWASATTSRSSTTATAYVICLPVSVIHRVSDVYGSGRRGSAIGPVA